MDESEYERLKKEEVDQESQGDPAKMIKKSGEKAQGKEQAEQI